VALVEQVGRSTERVSEIALALKRYTYLGQAEVLAVDIHQGLEDTLLLLGHKLTAGPEVTRDFADGPLRVWGIGSELNQVWMNLIDNAVDAAGSGGLVVLRTRSAPTANGLWVIVQVEDDGPGIPDEVRSRVFEPFFTTKAPGSGTGLGLATSWSIVVNRHHGSLAVESTPGRTVFTVELPVIRPEANERSSP
jgi:signal transduction histidine kinase